MPISSIDWKPDEHQMVRVYKMTKRYASYFIETMIPNSKIKIHIDKTKETATISQYLRTTFELRTTSPRHDIYQTIKTINPLSYSKIVALAVYWLNREKIEPKLAAFHKSGRRTRKKILEF